MRPPPPAGSHAGGAARGRRYLAQVVEVVDDGPHTASARAGVVVQYVGDAAAVWPGKQHIPSELCC